MSPQRANLVLAADVPDIEFCVLVCDGFDVEADGGDCGNVLIELELVEDGWANMCQQWLELEALDAHMETVHLAAQQT